MPIDDIVKVTISKETTAAQQAGFGVPLFVGDSTAMSSDRIRVYTTAQGLLDDGFLATDEEYLAAVAAFSQRPAPSTIAIGREDAGDASVGATMDAILAATTTATEWYGFAYNTRAEADVLALALWCEAQKKIYSAQTSDAAVLAGTAGNVMEDLNGFGYTRTFSTYHAIDAEYLDFAWLARGLAADLDTVGGTITWANKTLAGITPDSLTATQRANVFAVNGNTYETRAGKAITRNGVMAADFGAGDWYIDCTTTIDWLDCRMTEDVYGLLTGTSTKIPFTQAGIDLVAAQVRARLELGVTNGHIDTGFTLTVPDIAQVSAANKTTRTLGNVLWTATLAGAIHTVEITGTVNV